MEANCRRSSRTFDAIKPPDMPVAQAMVDNGSAAPKTHVLSVGVYDAYKEEVEPGFLSILDPASARVAPPAGVNSTRTPRGAGQLARDRRTIP